GIALISRIAPRRKAYAEWYDWARRELGGGRERQHAAATVALERLDAGDDAGQAAVAARAALSAVPPPSPAFPPGPTLAAPPPAPSHAYGGFWRRGAAWLIDAVLLTIGFAVLWFFLSVFALFGLLSSGQDITDSNLTGVQLAVLFIAIVLAWLYFAGLESSG